MAESKPLFSQSAQRKVLIISLAILHIWGTILLIAALNTESKTIENMFYTVCGSIILNLGTIIVDSAYRKIVELFIKKKGSANAD